MASQRMNERFDKYPDPIVNLWHACGHKPTSCCWCRLCGMISGENVGTTETYEKTLELEEPFQKAASFAIHLILYSVRLDGSHDRVESRRAMQLTTH